MSDARDLTHALGGKWFGGPGGYGLAFCPAHENTRTPALRLRDGTGGRLLAYCSAGCGFADVAAALRGRGLLEGRPSSLAADPDPAAEAKRRAEERAEAEKRTAQARRLLAESRPIEGTLAERYLRARAIRGPLPASLLFNPQCWHGATAQRLPAMVAAVRFGREVIGAHRTYLAEPGAKADVAPVKAMLGPVRGGAVVLAAGAGPVVVAEGIETALSLRDGLADLAPRVLAALSASGVAGLRLPDRAGELVIGPDPDPAGMKAAEALATRAHRAGWRVRILPPPGADRDWNDAARAVAQDEGKAA